VNRRALWNPRICSLAATKKALASLSDGQIDRPRGARRQRDGDDLAVLAGADQGPVPAFPAEGFDIGASGLIVQPGTADVGGREWRTRPVWPATKPPRVSPRRGLIHRQTPRWRSRKVTAPCPNWAAAHCRNHARAPTTRG
jgi:hypothetical protein